MWNSLRLCLTYNKQTNQFKAKFKFSFQQKAFQKKGKNRVRISKNKDVILEIMNSKTQGES